VLTWLDEAAAEKEQAEAALSAAMELVPPVLSVEDVLVVVEHSGGLARVLHRATDEERAAPWHLMSSRTDHLGPDVTFPPFDNTPPGHVIHIRIERIARVGPWAEPARSARARAQPSPRSGTPLIPRAPGTGAEARQQSSCSAAAASPPHS
jgi:hypothetical protein